jgi:hypothetical protein
MKGKAHRYRLQYRPTDLEADHRRASDIAWTLATHAIRRTAANSHSLPTGNVGNGLGSAGEVAVGGIPPYKELQDEGTNVLLL